MRRIEKDEEELLRSKRGGEKLNRQEMIFDEKQKKQISNAKKRAQKIVKEAEKIAEKIKEQAQSETAEEKQAVIKQIKSRLSSIENDKN